MRPDRTTLAAALGLLATVAGLVLAVREFEPTTPTADPGTVVWLVGLGGLAAAAWLLYAHTRSGASSDPVPWSDAGPMVDDPPEAVTREHPLSGDDLAGTLLAARVAARKRREVEDGIAVVRPTLREVYVDAMVAAGQDRASAESALEAGTWTDDSVAAAVCSAAVDPPTRSRRRRVLDWLYPGRAVTRRTVRTVSVIAEAADDALSPVVGSDAPRTVETYEPSLAVRTVGADGQVRRLQRDTAEGTPEGPPGEPTDDSDASDESRAPDDTGTSADQREVRSQ